MMLWPDSICCCARASVIIHESEIFNLVIVAISASLLTNWLCHRMSLNGCLSCPTVGCGLSRSLVVDISISIISTRDISETVLLLQESQLILSLLLISWINHACKLINIIYTRHSFDGTLQSVWGKRCLNFPKVISFS